MAKIKVFNKLNAPEIAGSSFKGFLYTTYDRLIDVLGKPTYDEPSGDNKTQVEWVVEYKGKYGSGVFTIYDWKTYDREYTETQLDVFNVGGVESAWDFINYLETLL